TEVEGAPGVLDSTRAATTAEAPHSRDFPEVDTGLALAATCGRGAVPWAQAAATLPQASVPQPTAAALPARGGPAARAAPPPEPRGGPGWSRGVVLGCLLLAALCFVWGLSDWLSPAEPDGDAWVARPIEQFQVGDRILADSPTGDEDLAFGEEVDPRNWHT